MLKKKDHPSDIRVCKGPTQRIKTSTWSLLREAGDTQGGEPFYVSLISLKMQSHPELPDAEHKSNHPNCLPTSLSQSGFVFIKLTGVALPHLGAEDKTPAWTFSTHNVTQYM